MQIEALGVQLKDEESKARTALTGRAAALLRSDAPQSGELPCGSARARNELRGALLWRVFAHMAASSRAVQTFELLHESALEEGRIVAELVALRDALNARRIALSSTRTFDCLLLINLPELTAAIESTLQQVHALRNSRYGHTRARRATKLDRAAFSRGTAACL